MFVSEFFGDFYFDQAILAGTDLPSAPEMRKQCMVGGLFKMFADLHSAGRRTLDEGNAMLSRSPIARSQG